MKTIRGPKDPGVNEIECDKCHALMECTAGELRFVSDQRDGDAYVMKCPHCQHETWVAADLIKK